jgi:hypothetical protein
LPGLPPEAPETPVLNLLFSAVKRVCIFWFPRILNCPCLRLFSFGFNRIGFNPAEILHDPLSFGFSGVCVLNQNTLKKGS